MTITKRYSQWPSQTDIPAVEAGLPNIHRFPGVIGAVDSIKAILVHMRTGTSEVQISFTCTLGYL